MRIPIALRETATALLTGAVIAASAATASALPTDAVPTPSPSASASTAPTSASATVRRACAEPGRGRYACLAEVVVPSRSTQRIRARTSTITGLKPADIASAYRLKGGHRGLVAVVGAYDDPNLESDLAHYRKQFHLPACTTRNGCFRKVNHGGPRPGCRSRTPAGGSRRPSTCRRSAPPARCAGSSSSRATSRAARRSAPR